MRLIVFVAAILIVLGAILVLRAVFLRRFPKFLPQWETEEISLKSGVVSVRLVKPGQDPIRIGEVSTDREDFDMEIEMLRAEATHRAVVLNAPARRRLRRSP